MNPPGLDGHGVPRRNPKFSGSTPSLPSVSDIAVSDTGVEGLGARSPNEGSDIRNTIGPKHNIRSQDGKWVRKHNWDNPLGLEDDYVFNTMPFNDAFVTAWDNGVPHDISADFLDRDVREHWRCDVDTNTGYLIPPVEYPETLVDLGKLREELDWRRQNWTSALLIRRNTANTRGNLRGRRYENFQLRHYQEPNEPEIFEINPVVEEPKIEIVHNSLAPRVASYLRPAQKADMAAVTAIYNWEMKNGLQTLDSQPLSVEDFEKIFDDTQKLGMPFLVAVTGSAKDLKSKHNGAVTLSLYRHMPVDMVTLPSQDRNGKILGFAYLSVWQPGLAGSGVGSSRATASINLFVDPQFRKMKIGFSLMDKLLSTISRRFSSESAYDFVDPTRSPVYQGPKSHERQYFRLYLSYLVKHKYADHQLEEEQKTYDDDLKWVKKLLEEKFNFREKIRFEAVHRSAKAREGPLCWLDSVVFEHACQFGPADCTY
ncbi:hypothetical protein B0H63DRAFT_403924 [Podospora didyma]|uniref:N-acetyltransferase domain-containing protein n=1 Tax=Podospora didyma TaxID=330526 RepID=A0AAE0K269_9PEZI|nr:hypothetical protein B0H63DRAFT_403924 [Podospora didyma]